VSALAPTLESWFTDRLIGQRHASPNTVSAYRDTWRLLLGFVQSRTGSQPSRLDIADLHAELIGEFLNHLEQQRHNGIPTRNARLAAIRSFYRYAALRHPEHAELIARVLDIPTKRCERKDVSYLNDNEADALLEAPNRSSWTGRRDHALLGLAVETGLRVSELTGLRVGDVQLSTGAHVRCLGKGRKHRCTPISKGTAALLRAWIYERGSAADEPLFPTRRGTPLTRSAVRCLVAKHAATAAQHCPSLQAKRLTPHALRHTCAMSLLAAGCDTSVIALWLGHEQSSTTDRIYLHGDMSIKQRALDRTRPRQVKPGRYRPPDPLLAFLANL
jgi:site-specific recombinase XerD